MDKEKVTYYRSHRWVAKRPRPWLKQRFDRWMVLTALHRLTMERRPWKGTFCTAASYLANGTGERGGTILRQREWPDMRKVARPDAGLIKHLAAMETNLLPAHMAIIEHLAMLQYDDGTPRQPGRLMIETRGSAWCVLCKDHDSGMQLPIVGVTLDDALDALQVHLGSENAPWEPDPWAKGQAGKKSKK